MTDATSATSYPLPRPALIWDADSFLDAAEAIDQHPEVRRLVSAFNSIAARITAGNIDALAPNMEQMIRRIEDAKDDAAAEYGLQWARRIRL
jgi:hypothetical protein